MVKTPNYDKWHKIYVDYKNGMTWDALATKHSTSKRTIGKSIKYFNEIGNISLNNKLSDDIQLELINKKIKSLKIELKHAKSEKIQVIKEKQKASPFNQSKKNHLDQTLSIIKILETLKNPTRMWLILILNMYREMSLGALSKKLRISKSTVSRHLKFLEETGIIYVREKKVRGSRLKKYFSCINVSEIIERTRLSRSLLRDVPIEKALDTHSINLNVDTLSFLMIKKILDKVASYNNQLQTYINEFKTLDHNTLENIFSTENYSKYYFWFLNTQQFEVFKKKYRQFFEELRKEFELLTRQDNNDRDVIKPYLIWHITIPIKNITDLTI